MFIKLAFVILLSVEIEACNVRVRKIPANISDRFLRDPFTKKLFLKWATFSNFIVILSSNPADSFSKTISDEWITITIFKKSHFPSVFHRSIIPDRVLQQTWPKVNLNTYIYFHRILQKSCGKNRRFIQWVQKINFVKTGNYFLKKFERWQNSIFCQHLTIPHLFSVYYFWWSAW